jgi:hypothetical protein
MSTLSDSSWPLVLSTEVTVPSQTTQRPPQLALMNPTGEAFKIHEIRFSLKEDDPSALATTGATMGCKLEIGTVALTNGFVPIWNFGRVISFDQDLNLQYSWRLQHPIYIPAGGTLMPTFQHYGITERSLTVRISYFASVSPAGTSAPRRIFLPWVSAYTGKAFPYPSADSDVSRETDLLNPFDSDLLISRLIGRYNLFNATGSTNTSRFGAPLMDVRVSLSNGDPLVRTDTPFQQVFGMEGRAWEQRNTILKPKQFFQVFVTKRATSDAATDSTIQPYVSLVGYRELQVSS